MFVGIQISSPTQSVEIEHKILIENNMMFFFLLKVSKLGHTVSKTS